MPQGDGRGKRRVPGDRPGGRSRPDPKRSSGKRPGYDRGGPPRESREQRDAHAARNTPVGEPPPDEPDIAADVDLNEIDPDVREELQSLSSGARKAVIGHLVMASRLIDEDPGTAYVHTLAARRRAGRIGVVREAAGVAAYHAGKYADALRELRAARRITGSVGHLPMMADCERGLGRPRRALEIAADPAAGKLDTAGRMEMLVVAAGARRDLGETEAAAVLLQVPELRSASNEPWVARLRYAYADALFEAGRTQEAQRWFAQSAEADPDEITDAAARAHDIGEHIT